MLALRLSRLARSRSLLASTVLLLAACAPAAPAAPTTPPTSAAAKPAAASSPASAPSAAPAAASPAAKPAASPSSAAPSPVVSPVAAAKPAAQPTFAPFDEQAVAGFYRGKTLRVVIGFGAGGLIDTYSRTIARYLGKYVPGNPTVVVENRPGAGSLTAANGIYKTDPKDGTVLGSFGLGLVLSQAVGGANIEFDAAKFNWIGAANTDNNACLVRSSQAQSLQDLMGPTGKEVATGSLGAGTDTYQVPATMNMTIGTHFKLVPGYGTLAQARLAFDSGEIDAYCPSFSAILSLDHERLEGANPPAKMVSLFGDFTPNTPIVQGVPKVVDLATGDDQKLIRAIAAQDTYNPPYAMAPEVPQDRVLALRRALAQTLADPDLLADAQKTSQTINWQSAEAVQQGVKDMLELPQSIKDRMKPLVV